MVEQLPPQNELLQILKKYFLTQRCTSFHTISAVVLVLLLPQKLAHPLYYYQLYKINEVQRWAAL
jgi:hypothetical protein